jgi:hypothetical protein
MKKRIIIGLILVLALIVSACTPQQETAIPDFSEDVNVDPGYDVDVVEPPADDISLVAPPLAFLDGLTQDEYDGITISAEVLERMAILPGASVPISIVIENTGNESVYFIQGSGSFETPEALVIYSQELQTVRARDHLVMIQTMDFIALELQPGESLLYRMYVLAIEPNENFDTYSFDFAQEGEFIADVGWSALHESHPNLVPVSSGSFTVDVFFLYAMSQEDVFTGATGFAMTQAVIPVS